MINYETLGGTRWMLIIDMINRGRWMNRIFLIILSRQRSFVVFKRR